MPYSLNAEENRVFCGHPVRGTFLFAAALSIGLAGAAAAAPAVSSLSGSVFVLRSGTRVWQPTSAGHLLEAGDQVRTAAGASAVITFDDGSRINLGSNGSFTLQESTSGGTSLKLSIGSLRAWVNKALSRRFDVRTPTAVCSVRGTEFAVDVNAQGHTNIQMFSGVLAVADQRGNETVIRDRENLRVTDKGFSGGQGQAAPQSTTSKDKLKDQARREVGLEMSKEAVQAAAAAESMNAVYKEGKTLIDVNGFRVRLEEYIVRSDPNSFKLVVLNEREQRFDYFYYKGTFNTTLPDDLSIALRQLPGCIGAACQYFMTDYETARSNTQDNMLEVASGGHPIDVNNDGVAADAVSAAYDPATDAFIALAPGTPFFQTLFDYNKLTFNGVPHNGWVPANPAQAIANGGAGIPNMGAAINTGAVAVDMANPVAANYSPASLTTVRDIPVCAPPNCTYNESGILHQVIYADNGAGVWEKYDSYIISDEGKVASTGDFAGTTTGTLYKQTLLKWNFETVVTASEFDGRKIDLVVEPKIFIQSGLIQ
ncbi:MAG: FecR domain-containing protein [Elusimicrobia bacterium]|nr:FecR domain-containing protein [Elusimicrobiota bacterium]